MPEDPGAGGSGDPGSPKATSFDAGRPAERDIPPSHEVAATLRRIHAMRSGDPSDLQELRDFARSAPEPAVRVAALRRLASLPDAATEAFLGGIVRASSLAGAAGMPGLIAMELLAASGDRAWNAVAESLVAEEQDPARAAILAEVLRGARGE